MTEGNRSQGMLPRRRSNDVINAHSVEKTLDSFFHLKVGATLYIFLCSGSGYLTCVYVMS